MGEFLLAVICTILVNGGVTLFEAGTGTDMSQYLSSVIFTVSILVLVTNNKQFSKILKQFGPFKIIFQMFLYMFLLEVTLKLCWFPMETNMMELPNKIAEIINYVSKMLSIKFQFLHMIQSVLKTKAAKIGSSYFLSSVILLGISQYVQILDVYIIKQIGFGCFLSDIITRNFCNSTACDVPIRRRRRRNANYSDDDFDYCNNCD